MTESRTLRVLEVTRGIAGSACGRLFAGLGHEVVKVEPVGGTPLRSRPPLNADGVGLTFVALNADKRSITVPDGTVLAGDLSAPLDTADILILDLTPDEATAAGFTAESLRMRWPELVVVWITAFGRDGDFADIAGDSLLAESYGGLATMIGDPARRPLSLGGEQIAHCAAFTGFFGAMIALRRRDDGHRGDIVDVSMSDVAAYADWKSDLSYYLTGVAPRRAGSAGGEWKMIRATDGWVGAIFQQQHWRAMVELIDHPVLRDPELTNEVVRLARAQEWWPIVDEWAADKSAEDIYRRAQELGLPFGWAVPASGLARSEQFVERGFVQAPGRPVDGRTPVVGSPVHSEGLLWRSGAAPDLAPEGTTVEWTAPASPPPVPGTARKLPLDGVVVLDFGAITAGAAATRLLADHGATVLKIESVDRPDTFRIWKMPQDSSLPDDGSPRQGSPYFPSNNVGKRAVAVDLKTAEGRAAIHQLAARSHVFVENFRVGVTERLGIDEATLRAVNPDIVYLSLSSQGQRGPESRNRSFGSTLDLLSGLASVTGYEADRPTWSSSDVNYPDQLVSLVGAAFAVYCITMGITGVTLDCSQREAVSWTLATEIAQYLVSGVDSTIDGNRRPGRAPHDTYPTREIDRWLAISCADATESAALARCIGADELADRDRAWWEAHQDEIDDRIIAWSTARTRDDAVAALRAAGVPAVPVLSAADRARIPAFVDHLVRLPGDGPPIKGVPLRFSEYRPPLHRRAPAIGEDTLPVFTDFTTMSDDELARLEADHVIYAAPGSRRVGSLQGSTS